jgi:hypothetical protein
MIRHYVARRAQVIFDHPHNADVSKFATDGIAPVRGIARSDRPPQLGCDH